MTKVESGTTEKTDREETVFVRDEHAVRQYVTADDWVTVTLLGALSADPRNLHELGNAWRRYEPHRELEDVWQQQWDVNPIISEPSGPWLVIDLALQRVMAGGGAEVLAAGGYQRDEGPWHRDMPVAWINHPPHWQTTSSLAWSEAFPPLPTPSEPLDVRGVLFGRPLAEGLAERTMALRQANAAPDQFLSWDDLGWEQSPTEEEKTLADRWGQLTVRVHADWLMTPRADLDGEMPRVFLHRQRCWVDRELANRQQQWAEQGVAPPPLDRDTMAYRDGPLGRHEVVMYFRLCRELLRFAWSRIAQSSASGPPELSANELADQLYERAQWWLAEGSIDGDPTPPGLIIENERRRLPLLSSGSHIDCDCPLCRMEADGSLGLGPAFCGYDGHHLELDDEFAFSLCETPEQWHDQQEELERFIASCDEVEDDTRAEDDDGLGSVWKTSFVSEEVLTATGPTSIVAVMALAARLAEVIDDLKRLGTDPAAIEILNRSFDDYRAAKGDRTLFHAATALLVDALEEIAVSQPSLASKVADLQSQLHERSRVQGS